MIAASVEQILVMRYQDVTARLTSQEARQQRPAVHIEMIGGLVDKRERVVLHKKRDDQRAGLLATAQCGKRSLQSAGRQTESGKSFLDACIDLVAAVLFEPGGKRAVAGEILFPARIERCPHLELPDPKRRHRVFYRLAGRETRILRLIGKIVGRR